MSQLKICDFSGERLLKVLKCYNFLWVQRRHNCSPASCFANCVMTLYLLKVHLQTFLPIPITQKFQILSCDTLVANERYILILKCSLCGPSCRPFQSFAQGCRTARPPLAIQPMKADSHIACLAHAMPRLCTAPTVPCPSWKSAW